eukprot:COSAG06_NODE_32667_length_502_cov_1.017370_1_plen_51_part_01
MPSNHDAAFGRAASRTFGHPPDTGQKAFAFCPVSHESAQHEATSKRHARKH